MKQFIDVVYLHVSDNKFPPSVNTHSLTVRAFYSKLKIQVKWYTIKNTELKLVLINETELQKREREHQESLQRL